ncbi:MAG: NAD(+)/NADH kinase [Oscillospiraceae bacterium]|nr:NAD(+)/NADH kinase [Oscillospiraceae bacterium]
MKKIVLCPNPARDVGFEYTKKYYEILSGRGIDVCVCPIFENGAGEIAAEGLRFSPLDAALDGADMAVAFGGDGTILRVSRLSAPVGTPVLGVNLGKKGFIAELERDETDMILKALDGENTFENRMMLDVSVIRNGEAVYSDYALNEVFINGIARSLDITVTSDGKHVISFSGDGVVIATPTGSTAYSMAAGGPIMEPAIENIIMTPICAHMLMSRSYILSAGAVLGVTLGNLGSKAAYISADGGRMFDLSSEDTVEVRRSKFVTRLVKLSNKTFYEKVSEKLGGR